MIVSDCHFCKLLPGLEEPANSEVVWRFPRSIAILGRWQYYHGYCVLIVREHASELSQLELAARRDYLEEMCCLARAIEVAFQPHKLNYEALGNQVAHLHWHIFPRYLDDPARLNPVWLALDAADRDADLRHKMETGPSERVVTIARLQRTLTELDAPRA